MSWLESVGEFVGSFGASFLEHRARTKQRMVRKSDDNIAAYDVATKGLKDCLPMEDNVTRRGLRELCKSLKRDDHFGAQLAIDANPGLRKRDICVSLLKVTVTYLCSENPADLIRSATYTIIACR